MFRNFFSKKAKTKPTENHAEEEAAITIQKHIRAHLAKKKYRMPNMHPFLMESYDTFVVGNDPIIDNHEGYHVGNEKIALVATSGMRAVLLACDLGNFKQTPKILLVDNSRQVCDFWVAMRAFMQDKTKTGSRAEFTANLIHFLTDNYRLYRDLSDFCCMEDNTTELKYPNQNIMKFFDDLFDKHGYENVRAVICHASVIRQSWESEAAFEKIRNVLDFHEIDKVFAYASNILACTQDKAKEDMILKNIAKLRPVMTIHTEGVITRMLSMHSGKPHCLESSDPEFVSKELKLDQNRFEDRQCNPMSLITLLSMFGSRGNGSGIRIVFANNASSLRLGNYDDHDDSSSDDSFAKSRYEGNRYC